MHLQQLPQGTLTRLVLRRQACARAAPTDWEAPAVWEAGWAAPRRGGGAQGLGRAAWAHPASLSFSARAKWEDSWLNTENVRLPNQDAESRLYQIMLN